MDPQVDPQDVEAGAIARREFIRSSLNDLPDVYHGGLGGDPSKWPAEAKGLRDKFAADKAAYLASQQADTGTGGETPATRKSDFLPANTGKQAAAIKMPSTYKK